MPKSAKKLTKMENHSSDDEDDALDMERNFALLSKRSAMRTSAEDEEKIRDEDGSAEEDEAPEEDEDGSAEDDEAPEEDEDGSAEDDEAPEEHGDGSAEVEDNGMDDEGDSGSDEGDTGSEDDESVSDHEDGGSQAQSQRKGSIKSELSTMSFEEILKLQNKVGTKAYNKIAYGATKQQQKNEPMKRLNKHRPQEISAKKHVPFLRKVVPVKKRISRDPRFDDLSGEFKPEIFNKTHKFINDLREKEAQLVKKNLKKAKSKTKKGELKALLKRMENQQRERQRQEQDREKELEFKRKQRELVGQGHKPFYLKKSDMKKLELAEKYSELKRSGKLENFLSKKRKRNATKDRKKLPNMR